MNQAQKERVSIFNNECDGLEIEDSLEELLLSWKEISKEVILKLHNCELKNPKSKEAKSFMALGAMEVHINMAIQALKASQIDKK